MRTRADQEALEREMLTLGCDRVRVLANERRTKRMESLSKWGEALSAHGIDRCIPHLRAIRKKIEQGKAGVSFALLNPVTQLPPQQTIAAAIRTVIDSLSTSPTVHSVAIDIAEKLWIETMLDRASKDELIKLKKGRSRKAHKMAAIRHMERTEIWTPKEKIASGLFLLQLIERETGLIEIVRDDQPWKKRRVVRATKECIEWINKVKEQQELMTPNYLPMYIKPRDWVSPLDGGYLTKLPLKLMKSNNEIINDYCTGQEPFIKAANIHQSVPWQINRWMLEQVTHAYDNNIEIGCLIPRDGWPVPPYPKHLEDDDPNVEKWRRRVRGIHEKNERTRAKRIGNAKTLWVARRFKEEEHMYFVMSLDFRGRYYYRPPYLNPQGNDVARALLQFARPVSITQEEETDWLRIHGANLYGLGKSDFRTRIDWVHEREQLILGAGNDPWLNAEFWMRADKPWAFLAFCRAYFELKQKGSEYQCHLPIMLDCTCSGIQHYAALLRCETMGELVNLKENESPQDIYTNVITRVNEELRVSKDPRAQKWLMLQPDRSLAKPCVMTTPYSATHTAFYYYAYDWAQKRTKDLFGTGSWTVRKGAMTTMHFMAKLLHKHATALISPAVEAMKWFRSIGLRAGRTDRPLEWITPSGLLVHQQYNSTKETRVRLRYLSDVYLDIRTQIEQPSLDSTRMANALSANVLHSFDASHMAFATIHASMNGVHNIGGVHDCFITDPASMSTLRESVRHSFSDLYATDWLSQLKEKLRSQLNENQLKDLPTEPELGGLDPSSTRSSNYFIT
tara:strand:+ start:4472 stop:6847 length:2376 start_codon:yes stop_codon:yes gene_type:complete